MAKLWQRSPDPKTNVTLLETDLHNFSIRKPTVILLTGIFTTDSHPKNVDEALTEIEGLLAKRPEFEKKPDLYAASLKDLRTVFNIAAYHRHPDRAHSRQAAKMADRILLPLVLDGGKPLKPGEARDRLRNVTFVAYSAGTVFAQEMFNYTLKKMKSAGYAEKDARDILSETVLVSLAAISRPADEKSRFTTVYLAATNDLAVRITNRLWRPLKALGVKKKGDLALRQLSPTSLLATAHIDRKLWHWREDDNGDKRRENIPPLLPAFLGVASNHEMPHYTTADDGHNQFSGLALNAIVNAVNRTGKMAAVDLLAPVTARRKADVEAYKGRLLTAFQRGNETGDAARKKPKIKKPKPDKNKRKAA